MPIRAKVTVHKSLISTPLILINAFGTTARPGSLLLSAKNEIDEIGKGMAQEMRNNLYTQRFKMAPLTARYLRYKKRKGLDVRTLIAYKKYVQNIAWIPTPYGGRVGMKNTYRIDMKGNKPKRLEYWKLQLWLEYGTKVDGRVRMPARPHWRPAIRSWKEHRKAHGLRIKNRVGFEIRKLIGLQRKRTTKVIR